MVTTLKMSKLNPAQNIPNIEGYADWGQSLKTVEAEAIERNPGRGGCYKYSYLPMPLGEEKLYSVATADNSPWKNLDVLGVTFDRDIFQPMTELGRHPEPAVCIISLAENQLMALQARICDHLKVHHSEHTGDTWEGKLSTILKIERFYGVVDQSLVPLKMFLAASQTAATNLAFPGDQPRPVEKKKRTRKKKQDPKPPEPATPEPKAPIDPGKSETATGGGFDLGGE